MSAGAPSKPRLPPDAPYIRAGHEHVVSRGLAFPFEKYSLNASNQPILTRWDGLQVRLVFFMLLCWRVRPSYVALPLPPPLLPLRYSSFGVQVLMMLRFCLLIAGIGN